MLELGYWPVPIYPRGYRIPRPNRPPQIAEGKEPIGKAWGRDRPTEQSLRETFRRYSGAGVGMCLGPDRAPGGEWLIDVESDGADGDLALAEIFAGELVPTLGWTSARGAHRLFRLNADQVAELLGALAKFGRQESGLKTGVWHMPGAPGLEFRMGGWKDEAQGIAKQVQSVAPPTLSTEGIPRQWTGEELLEWPGWATDRLLEMAERARQEEPPATIPVRPRPSWSAPPAPDDCRDLVQASEMLRCLDPSSPYKEWLDVGMALHARFHGSSEALKVWEGWSRPSDKFTEGECEDKWRTFSGDGVKFGTIVARAKAAGWRPSRTTARATAGGSAAEPTERAEEATGDRPLFTNLEFVGDKKKPVDQPELLAHLGEITSGAIRRVGSGLFAHDGGDADLLQLASSESLFAYVAQRARIYWGEGPALTTKKQLFEAARQNVPQFEAVEKYPHFPPVPRVYYACSQPKEPGDGSALDGLLSLFSPATDLDRELIRAFVLTLFWGGPAGKRPMFLAEGPADDPKNGRGVGKSDLFAILAKLVGNPFSNVSARDDISTITKRIINDSGRKRVLLLDNVKSERFSWGDLEALITAPTVSGHRLFVGEETRPNLIVYAMTMNGASLSEDLAQRVVMIRLARPESYHRDGKAWEEHVSNYIARHYPRIVADVMATFNAPPQPIRAEQRWAEWTHKVLARCHRADELQQLLVERQGDINDDRQAARDFGQFLAAQIRREKSCDPAGAKVWFSAEALVPIVSAYTGEKVGQRAVSKKIGRMKPPELTKSDGKHARGWLWTGPEANPHSRPDRWVHAHPVPEEQEEGAEGPVF